MVLALVDETPDMTLVEIATHLESEHGLRVSQSTVWRFFHRRGITFKKTAHASEQQRPDVLRRGHAWVESQPDLDPEKLVFVDETGASTKMARRSGRALRGHRCRAPAPQGHWKTTTFVGALRLSGMTAPMVLDGAMHGAAFLAYVEKVLVPTLEPGDIVVMTTFRPTEAPPLATPFAEPGQSCASCRPTAPTSTRSRWPSPSSRPTSSDAPPVPSPNSGRPSAKPQTTTPPPSAKTTSLLQDTTACERKVL